MSFAEFKDARAARAAKNNIKSKGKGKRGRKRKSDMLKPGEPEPEGTSAAKEVINGRGKRGRKRKSDPEPEPEPEVVQRVAPVPWRPPVARMI